MSTQPQDEPAGTQPFDLTKRYVRLRQVRADGFIEFEFAIGDPQLCVDLILPAEAYREFCRNNQAVLITAPPVICPPQPSQPQGDPHVG